MSRTNTSVVLYRLSFQCLSMSLCFWMCCKSQLLSYASLHRSVIMSTSSLQQVVNDGLTCSICEARYNMIDRQPKILKCAHTFCMQCIEKLIGNVDPRQLCLKDVIDHDTDIDSIPNNFTV